jgi:hypothetical protein
MFTRITRHHAVNAFAMAGGTSETPIPLIDLITELQLTGVPLPEVLVGIAEQLTSNVFEASGTQVKAGPHYA